MVIDAHQHFWKYDPVRYNWIDDRMPQLKRDFLPEELKKVFKLNQVDGCIAVQADQSEEETHFLLQLADEYNFVKGVVGWVDLRSIDLQERLEYFSQYRKLSGFRHVVQDETDVNFLLRPSFLKGIECLKKYNFSYDILIFPQQLGAALEFVRLFPDHAFVIDHIAKPYIKDGFFDGWAVLMRAIAQYPNVSCKISGMVTEADWHHWKFEDFLPYLDLVVEAFGVDRLMFGSDWPVCLLAATYREVKGIAVQYFAGFSPAEKEAIFGGNAMRFYNDRN